MIEKTIFQFNKNLPTSNRNQGKRKFAVVLIGFAIFLHTFYSIYSWGDGGYKECKIQIEFPFNGLNSIILGFSFGLFSLLQILQYKKSLIFFYYQNFWRLVILSFGISLPLIVQGIIAILATEKGNAVIITKFVLVYMLSIWF